MARKKGMQFIPYDYEAAYNKALEDMHEWFIENLFQHRKKVVYALKEITAGDQFEIEIYPQFRSMDEVPPEGRTIKKDNNKAQKNLNDKNARKYVERLINENFSDRDIWMTLTYDDAHLPPDGDVDAAIKNVQKYIRRINYQRKKRGLPNAKYVYVTAYNPDAEIRWHHHIVIGSLTDDVPEGALQTNPDGSVNTYDADGNKTGTVDAETLKEMTTVNDDVSELATGDNEQETSQKNAEDDENASNEDKATNPPTEQENGENGANTEPDKATEEQQEDKVIIPQGKMRVTVICDGSLNIRRSAAWGNDNICGRAIRGQSYYVKEIHVVDGKKMVRTIGDLYLSGESEHVQFEQL